MRAFHQHSGVAVPLLRANIDTDSIIPSREMKSVSKSGLADGLFANWRYLDAENRDPDPEFALNQARYRNASILLSGANFGCGSSREHAAWALAEFGIRVIIAEGFGGIFFNNCVRNGLLPVVLPSGDIDSLARVVAEDPQAHQLTVDLQACEVSGAGQTYRFALDDGPRDMLLSGHDPIDVTRLHRSAIDAFESADRERRPWVYPSG